MPEAGTSVGAVYLDFVVRGSVQKQIESLTQKAQATTQRKFAEMGNAAAQSMERAFQGSYSKTLETARAKVASLEKQFDALGGKMDSMRASTKRLFSGIKSPGAAADQFLGSDKAFTSLAAQQDKLAQQLEQAQEKLRIETEANAAKRVAVEQRAAEKIAQAAERARARQEAAALKAAAVQERVQERQQAAAQRAATAQEQAAQRAAAAQEQAVKRAAAMQEQTVQRAAAAQAREQARAAQESERQWKKATGGMNRMFKTVGGTLKATFVTAGLYAFFRGMKSMMSVAAGQSKQFSTALNGVKNNLAAAFAPIMNAVLPMLTALMNGLERVTRAVATFIAALFGQTFSQADAAAKKMNSIQNAAGGAAKALKKTRTLLSVDELNVLNQQDESGGGGGVSGEIGNASTEMSGLSAAMERFWARFRELMSPSLAAWSAAWEQIKQKAISVWPQIKTAAQGLWDTGLKPLGEYLLTDFAPTCSNAFSQAFAPIIGGLTSTYIQIWANNFTSACNLISDAINSIAMPILELFKNVWTDMMSSVQNAWTQYGQPIMDGMVLAFQNVWKIIQNLWDVVLKPFLQFCIEKATELWNQHLKPLWDNVCGLIGDISVYLLTYWNEVLLPFIDWLVQTFGPYFEKAWEMVATVVKNVIAAISDRVNLVITIFRGLLQFMTAVFRGDWQSAWNVVKDTVSNVWDGIKDIIRGTVNGIIDIVNGMISTICEGINSIIRAANSIGGKVGIQFSPVTAPQIPHLASGGYVGPNQPQLAMIGDNKREGEIVAPESKIAEAVAQGMRVFMAQAPTVLQGGEQIAQALHRELAPLVQLLHSGRETVVKLVLGEREVTQMVVDGINRETQQTGNSPLVF